MPDISAETCVFKAEVSRANGNNGTASLILALWAALDRAEAEKAAAVEASFIEGFDLGYAEYPERALRPWLAETAQQAWLSSDAIRALPTPPALPASPLGAVAMRDVASAVVAGMAPFYIGETRFADHASLSKQVANLPLPDHAALLAAAMKLPEVAALVEAAQGVIARWDSPDWKSGHTLDHITKLRAAIAPFTGAKP
jgi:hypothetical protein